MTLGGQDNLGPKTGQERKTAGQSHSWTEIQIF